MFNMDLDTPARTDDVESSVSSPSTTAGKQTDEWVVPPINEVPESVEQPEPAPAQPAQLSENDAAAFDADDRDSVAAYMEQLLARSRNWKDGQSSSMPWQPPARETRPTTAAPATSVAKNPVVQPAAPVERVVEPAKPLVPLEELGPSHRQDKDAVRAHLASMREVANLTARTAIARHTWRKHRSMLAVKFTLAAVSFAFAFVLGVTGLFGGGSYGIYVWSSIAVGCVMVLELGRTMMQLRRAKSRKSMFSQSSESELEGQFSELDDADSDDCEPMRPLDGSVDDKSEPSAK
jgi:hypothetical protein